MNIRPFANTTAHTCNVKGHFYVQLPLIVPPSLEECVVRRNNFWTFRQPTKFTFVYVVFPAKGYVNVSGIRDFAVGQSATAVFEALFGVRATTHLQVDNSTSSGRFSFADRAHRLHLPDLLRVREEHRLVATAYIV